MSAVHHVAPVKSHHYIAALEPGFLGGPFRLHISHDRAFHIGKTKDLASQRRDILRRGAEEPADNTTSLEQALHGSTRHITWKGETHTDITA